MDQIRSMDNTRNVSTALREIEAAAILAVIRVDTAEEAVGATRALLKGGVRGIEITYTIPGAGEVIARLAAACQAGDLDPAMLLGAGSVFTAVQAREAIDAGARFLVSPCLVRDAVEVARERGVTMLAGALTPTEIYAAYSLGADIVKVFPASHFGPRYLQEIHGPMPHIPLLPAGGIDASNAGDWLRAGAVALGAGGRIVDRTAIKNGDWATLTQRAHELMAAVRVAREER